MFEDELAAKLKRIFGVKKVTYNEVSDSQEQECLFVDIESSKDVIRPGQEKSMVTGKCLLYGNNEKIPFGFFSKAIQLADLSDTKDFCFLNFEENTRRFQNIVQRGFSFIYFHRGQYDPDQGTITSVDFIEEQA